MTKTEIFNLGEISAVTLRMGQLPTDCSMRIFSQFSYRNTKIESPRQHGARWEQSSCEAKQNKKTAFKVDKRKSLKR